MLRREEKKNVPAHKGQEGGTSEGKRGMRHRQREYFNYLLNFIDDTKLNPIDQGEKSGE